MRKEKEKSWRNFNSVPHLELAQNSWTTHQMKHQEVSSLLSGWVCTRDSTFPPATGISLPSQRSQHHFLVQLQPRSSSTQLRASFTRDPEGTPAASKIFQKHTKHQAESQESVGLRYPLGLRCTSTKVQGKHCEGERKTLGSPEKHHIQETPAGSDSTSYTKEEKVFLCL